MDNSPQTQFARATGQLVDALTRYGVETRAAHLAYVLDCLRTATPSEADFQHLLRDLRDQIDDRLTAGRGEVRP